MMIRNRKLGIIDIKQAIFDDNFQKLFPEFKEDIDKSLSDPGCPCNREIYFKFFQYPDRLKKFFPNREIEEFSSKDKLEENYFTVINCNISELETELKKLHPGNKQLAMCRYKDQVTVIVNHLGVYFGSINLNDEKDDVTIIDCDYFDLDKELRKLSFGRKQIALCRYEDRVTVIVKHLG